MNKLETIVVIDYALYDTDDASWNLSRMINTYRMRYEYAPDDGQYSEHMMNVAMKWAKGDAKVALKSAKKLWNGRDDDDDNEELQNVIDYLAMTITNPDGLCIPDKIKLLHTFEDEFDDKITAVNILHSDNAEKLLS